MNGRPTALITRRDEVLKRVAAELRDSTGARVITHATDLSTDAGPSDHGRMIGLDPEGLHAMLKLNVASLVAYFAGGSSWAAYVASKSYVLSLTRGLAAELKGTGVTVTALAPGSTSTDFVAAAGSRG